MQRIIKYLLFLSVILYACTKKENIVQNTPDPANTVTDIDGNRYPTVKIGDQIIMALNLKVSRYRNGDSIRHVIADTAWMNSANRQDSGAWCNYANNTEYDRVFGKLYNFYAVNDPRGLAPKGWHVLDTLEYGKIIAALGGSDLAGKALKSTILWNTPNAATNSSGFSALPGGYRYDGDGSFNNLGIYGIFWSTTKINIFAPYSLSLYYTVPRSSTIQSSKGFGYSVICVKD